MLVNFDIVDQGCIVIKFEANTDDLYLKTVIAVLIFQKAISPITLKVFSVLYLHSFLCVLNLYFFFLINCKTIRGCHRHALFSLVSVVSA